MKRVKAFIAGCGLLASSFGVSGFVMVGNIDANMTSTTIGGGIVAHNMTDDMGGPKELKTFFRINTPHITYGFHQTFIQAFGVEGMEAVNEAFRIMNDFFVPEDKSYVGVSSMDYTRDGFLNNFNTAWENTTAKNAQIIDMKSLMLGMLVNQLGVGNPHRYAFSIRSITPNNANTQWNFGVTLRNFDPTTWLPTDMINGVKYSYRLIHDANASIPLTAPSVADMEEFTTDTSGNAWTAVGAIADAFYGQTSIYWTDTPTLFNFGIYYDGINAMGGQYQPRHALTYDDAGGLKYLYRTNNFVMEDVNGTLITPPQLLPDHVYRHYRTQDSMWARAGLTSSRYPHAWPRRGTLTPVFLPHQSPFATYPIAGRPVAQIDANSTGKVGLAWRGGIDKIQFHEVPYDSILGRVFVPTNFYWTDTFVTDIGQTVYGLNNTTNGASTWIGPPRTQYYTQELGRSVNADPDIVIEAGNLGTTAGGVPIGWTRTANNYNDHNNSQPFNLNNVYTTVGPGVIELNATIHYQFATLASAGEEFSLIWSGEQSVVGNMDPISGYYQMWGHIKGPGPQDVVIFSGKNLDTLIQNEVEPQVAVPVITMVSDDGGVTAISTNSLTRTEETLTILGSGLGGGTAIEIMNGDLVVQTLFPVDKYLVSDLRIDIPAGVLNDLAEGTARTVRVWNTVGASKKSPQSFNIYTGRAIVTGTSKDGGFYDRAQTLTVNGVGFKSANLGPSDGGVKLTHFRVEDGQGNVLSPAPGLVTTAVAWDVVSDTKAILPLNSLTQAMDGTYRRIRVSRDLNGLSMSVTNNTDLITYVTTTPTITATTGVKVDISGTLTAVSTSVPLRRDAAIDIVGTAMNTATAIELVQADGSSFANPMVINLPNAGITVDDDGDHIQISANVIPYPDADGHTASQYRKFKVYNLVGNHTHGTLFNVNIQPTLTGYGGFTGTPKAFNYSPTGDDITLIGTGLMAVSSIQIVNAAGAPLSGPVSINLPSPGVTVSDTSIVIDTSAQQFANVTNANSLGITAGVPTADRRFSVLSARTAAISSATPTDMFIAGIPPTYDSTTKLAGTLAFLSPFTDFERDVVGTITFPGTGLRQMTSFEIVDVAGNTIGTVPAINQTGSATSNAGGTLVTLNITATTGVSEYSGVFNLLDDVTKDGNNDGRRRIKITTPFGSVTSATTDGFTISAKPDVTTGGAAQVFAGGGFNVGTTTYTAAASPGGDLLINDRTTGAGLKTFNGVRTITFENNVGEVFKTETVDPALPTGNGISFNAAGDQITITKAYLDAVLGPGGWADSHGATDRRIRLETIKGNVAGDTSREVVTPSIITTGQDHTAVSSQNIALSGAGWTPANTYLGATEAPVYTRNEAIVLTTGETTLAVGTITGVTLVEADGTAITGLTAIPAASGGLSFSGGGSIITIAANTWTAAEVAKVDSNNANRRFRILRTAGNGGDITSSRTFAVGDTGIDIVNADPDNVYTGAGYNTGANKYDKSAGPLVLRNDTGGVASNTDMHGVIRIDFVNNLGAVIAGTTSLFADVPGDFSVNAAGTEITLTQAIINAKGANWVADSGGANRALKVIIKGSVTNLNSQPIETDDSP